jgi:hypothetical protein
MQIAKTWDLAIRTPMAATIETTGTTATRQLSTIGSVTIRRTTAKAAAFSPELDALIKLKMEMSRGGLACVTAASMCFRPHGRRSAMQAIDTYKFNLAS